MSKQTILSQELAHLQLDSIADPLLNYLHLLQKWNAAYNLTAIKDFDDMISKHALDSLAILPWLHGTRLLDVGTGAGLPGIPLAIAKPALHFTLLDSNGKKTRFLNEVKRQLDLKNVEIVQSRVENYHSKIKFDTIISRAFSNLDQMIHWTSHLQSHNGIWLAMKGQRPDHELSQLHYPFHVEEYTVAGLEGERCVVIINNSFKD